MVKGVVKPVSMGYGCYQEIENPTPQKFFSAVIIPYISTIVKRLLSTLKICIAEVKENAREKSEIYFRKSAGLPLSSVVCCCANRRYNT